MVTVNDIRKALACAQMTPDEATFCLGNAGPEINGLLTAAGREIIKSTLADGHWNWGLDTLVAFAMMMGYQIAFEQQKRELSENMETADA